VRVGLLTSFADTCGKVGRCVDQNSVIIGIFVKCLLFTNPHVTRGLSVIETHGLLFYPSPGMGYGSLGLVRPGIVVSEELVVTNSPAEHEIKANLVLDGFDVRWIAVNIVVVITVHVCECAWWQRQMGHTVVS
jgi:hypothetical protein